MKLAIVTILVVLGWMIAMYLTLSLMWCRHVSKLARLLPGHQHLMIYVGFRNLGALIAIRRSAGQLPFLLRFLLFSPLALIWPLTEIQIWQTTGGGGGGGGTPKPVEPDNVVDLEQARLKRTPGSETPKRKSA